MTPRNIVVIGASEGGVAVLKSIAEGLPASLPAAVFVVQHIGAQPSQLPLILSGSGPLPAEHAADWMPIRMGRIYVAPPDRHMIVRPGLLRLDDGPKKHFTRPAIDPLFRSAAAAYGPRVVGMVLTGGGQDGTEGLRAIYDAGGLGVIQDPDDARQPAMPESAIKGDHPVSYLKEEELAPFIVKTVSQTNLESPPLEGPDLESVP